MNELSRVAQWLYSLLAPIATALSLTHAEGATTVVRVREGIAPSSWPTYYIIFQNQSPGRDERTFGGRVWATPLYLVKAVGKTSSWTGLAPIADAIDRQLDGATGTVDGYRIAAVRESPFSLIEYPGDVEYRHLGGMYRITL